MDVRTERVAIDDRETRAPWVTEDIRWNASDATVAHHMTNDTPKAATARPTLRRSSWNAGLDLRTVNIRNSITPGIMSMTVSGWLAMKIGAANIAIMVQGRDCNGFSIILTKTKI